MSDLGKEILLREEAEAELHRTRVRLDLLRDELWRCDDTLLRGIADKLHTIAHPKQPILTE